MCEVVGVQQGWQCPICKRIYAPHTSMCYYCGGDNGQTTVTTDNTGLPVTDWGKSITGHGQPYDVHLNQRG